MTLPFDRHGHRKVGTFSFLFCILLVCLAPVVASADADPDWSIKDDIPKNEGSWWDRVSRKYAIRNSIQTGLEYDTNIFKAFGPSEADFLIRGLFISRGIASLSKSFRLGWNYQGGGKKYIDRDEQDTLIQYVEVPFVWKAHPRVIVSLVPNFKYQDENNRLDAAPNGQPPIDINEDYRSTDVRLGIRTALPFDVSVEPFADFTYFHFGPQTNFSFYRERGGLLGKRLFGNIIVLGVQYAYERQQFEASAREDRDHEISSFLQYVGLPFFSARYTYQDTNSSDPRFTYTNHRITLLLSMPFLRRSDLNPEDSVTEEEETAALFTLHVIGTLQLKQFPSIFDFNAEGQRFLLTGAEDESFNSIVVKLSFHPFKSWAVEGKFTRHSNELSSQIDNFNRALFYGGLRFSF